MSPERNEAKSLSRNKEPPRLVFHGTTKEIFYLRLIAHRKHINFKNYQFYLTDDLLTALSYSVKRSKDCRDFPLLVILDPKKLEGRLEKVGSGEYRIRTIKEGSFLLDGSIHLDLGGHLALHSYEGVKWRVDRLKEGFLLQKNKKWVQEFTEIKILNDIKYNYPELIKYWQKAR